jgi:hypothetical protein
MIEEYRRSLLALFAKARESPVRYLGDGEVLSKDADGEGEVC